MQKSAAGELTAQDVRTLLKSMSAVLDALSDHTARLLPDAGYRPAPVEPYRQPTVLDARAQLDQAASQVFQDAGHAAPPVGRAARRTLRPRVVYMLVPIKPGKVSDQTINRLPPSAKKILVHLKQHGQATIHDLIGVVGPRATVANALTQLGKQKLVTSKRL